MSEAPADPVVEVRPAPERSRYELFVDGELAGFAECMDEGGGVLALAHTEVFPAYGGRGLGKRLVGETLRIVRENGNQVRPYCWFVRDYIKREPELADLVPEADRPRFAL